MSDLEMQSATVPLDYIKMDHLPNDTECYQVENGRTFYFKSTPPQRLYVKDAHWGDEINAKLPVGRIRQMAACGNEIYFSTDDRKIYKAVATMLDAVVVKFVRNMLEVTLVDNADVITAPKIHTIHRGKVVFVKCKDTAKALSIRSTAWKELIRITVSPNCAVAFARDISKYIYVPALERMHVLDTETENALPALSLSGLSNITVIGIRERTITLTAEQSKKRYLVTAKLPNGYFDSKKKEEQVNGNPLTKAIKDWSISKSAVSWQAYSDEMKWKREMRTTINELLDKNAELNSEISKSTDYETLNAFRTSNKQLEKESAQLKIETGEMKLQLARNIALNQEIDAANQQLSEEKAILTQELEHLNERSDEQNCLEKHKNEPKLLNASQENKRLREKLDLILLENENLIKSIAGKPTSDEINGLLTQNELVLKQVARV